MEKSKTSTGDIMDNIWMVRPCDMYLEEHAECKSFAGRFHQKYTRGQTLDCQKWKDDYENCKAFRKTNSAEFAEKIIINELERREVRLRNAKGNDVWEYRKTPPVDWSKPLPKQQTQFPEM